MKGVALDHVSRGIDVRARMHDGGDSLRQHARTRHAMQALDHGRLTRAQITAVKKNGDDRAVM